MYIRKSFRRFSAEDSVCRKSLFFLISIAISLSLCERSVAHLPDALLALTFRHPCLQPKPLPLGEGLCMLGGLCIVQSLLAYTPGIRAGLIIGGCRPCDLAWGFAPNPIYCLQRGFFTVWVFRRLFGGSFFILRFSLLCAKILQADKAL